MRNVRRDQRYTTCAMHHMHHTCQHAAWALVVTGRALVRRQRQPEGPPVCVDVQPAVRVDGYEGTSRCTRRRAGGGV